MCELGFRLQNCDSFKFVKFMKFIILIKIIKLNKLIKTITLINSTEFRNDYI